MTQIRNHFFYIFLFFLGACSDDVDEKTKDLLRRKSLNTISPTSSGSHLGVFFDREITHPVDRLIFAKALQRTLEHGASGIYVKWRNAITYNHGNILPFATYKNKKQQYCRPVHLHYKKKHTSKHYYAIACRQDNTLWEITGVRISKKL